MTQYHFSRKKRYVRTDGWRGYKEAVFGVGGVVDTGMYSDSPARSDVGMREMSDLRHFLRKNKIHTRRVDLTTSNVFAIHHEVIVPPDEFERGKSLAEEYKKRHRKSLNLLY